MKAKSGPRPKKYNFHKRKIDLFTIGTSGRFFCQFWRLLGRLEKEKKEESEDEKNEKWKTKKEKMKKKQKIEEKRKRKKQET